ncbi:MAG TPA: hypothetical protein PLY87_03400 [Planctomycetaceae bacterium]|mgnify:CR=1 FL=1|nr:hypothetical protein [Planctomycetaceae bacterium]HQZ64092.1 hypothetical protein [Planctomycetaceae bacterium]
MTYDELFENVAGLARQISDLHHRIAKDCEPVVERLIRTKSRDTREIEQTLDRLLDVCSHEFALTLYRRLCRHYFSFNPQAAANYAYAYRDMWDDEDDCKAEDER